MPQISKKQYNEQERLASTLKQQGEYEAARELYRQVLGRLALTDSPDALDLAYTAEARLGVGQSYILEALHVPAPARPALLAAANASLVAGVAPLADRVIARQYDVPQFTHTSASPEIKEISAYRRLYERLIDLHTMAAINPEHDWDPTIDHGAQIDAYGRAALNVVEPTLGSIGTIEICSRVIQSATLLGNDALRSAWLNEAHRAIGLAEQTYPSRAVSARVQFAIQQRELAVEGGALRALGAHIGLINGDEAMLLPTQPPTEA